MLWNSVYDVAWSREYLGSYRDLVDANMYVFRDLVRKHGLEQFPKKDPMRPKFYVHRDDGILFYTCDTEEEAIRTAEANARSKPGTGFFVAKTITRSYVAPTPAITTRL